MPNERESDHITSWDFIKENYRPDDRLAIVILNRGQAQRSGAPSIGAFTYQRIVDASTAASPRFQRLLRHENASGADIYISMSTLKPGAHTRTKADIAAIRHLYLDLDHDGAERLNQILADPNLPTPNYVLDTSPGKHQVIWRLVDPESGAGQGLTLEAAEAALQAMARQYGGDPAATDATRVLRLPGFHNKKYADLVRVEGHRLSDAVYTPGDFDRAPAKTRVGVSPTRLHWSPNRPAFESPAAGFRRWERYRFPR